MIQQARRLGVLLLGGALVLTGCGSSAEDQARDTLNSVLLQLSDFPPSWSGFPQPKSTPDLLGEIGKCTGLEVGDTVATVRSLEFRHEQQRISSTGVEPEHREDIPHLTDALNSSKANSCASEALRQRVLDAVPGATITSADFTVRNGGVNVAINYAGDVTGAVTVNLNGAPLKVYVDAAFLVGTTYYSDITFIGVGEPVSASIQRLLIDRIAIREQHAS